MLVDNMNSADPRARKNPLVYLDISIDGEPAGRVVIELRSDVVPKTAENFRALCTGEKGVSSNGKPLHYKGTKFIKAVAQFMIQGGDVINNNGSGGESIYGPTFEDENFNLKHETGVLSMANAGRPNTNASQFCITTVPCYHLEGTNVVFGEVLAGLDTVREVQKFGDTESGRPTVECVIEDCGEIITSDWDVCCRDGTADRLPEYPIDRRDNGTVTVDQLMPLIRDVKNTGNSHFGEGRYKAAARKYHKCIRFLNHIASEIADIKDVDMKEQLEEIRKTYTIQSYLNLAACQTKLGDFVSVVKFCSFVLELDPRNEKALYRRGQAYYALKNYDDALKDLKLADKIAPNNKAISKLLDEVRLTNKSYIDVQKQRLSKFFREQKEAEAYIEISDN